MESLIQMVSKGMGITVLPKPYIDFLQNTNIQALKIKDPTQRLISDLFTGKINICVF